MPSVDVSIVTWNSAAVIRTALDSVLAQIHKPAHIFVIDNASTDKTLEILTQYPQCELVVQEKNTGFAAAHNLTIAQSTADYILVMNPDVFLQPDYLANLCAFAEANPRGSAFVGTVLRPNGLVDTAGLSVTPWRFVRDTRERPATARDVFGVSGALALYRRTALLDVGVAGQFFNLMLFAYKEDVELAWRLQWAGWQAFCVPTAVAHHARVMQPERRRSARSVDRRFFSYRNHILLYSLVETRGSVLPDLWAIIPAELFRFLYLLVTDPVVTFRALAAAVKMWHAARTFARREKRAVHVSKVRAAFYP